MTEYLGSAIIPNGYNGHKATAHYCHDTTTGKVYCVWQTAEGLTGWHSLVTLGEAIERITDA